MKNKKLTNLYDETLLGLKQCNKTENDVLWCGNKSVKFTWKNFASIAKKTNYDDGFGSVNLASDLIIVGDGWWFERYEYDGSEGWTLKEMPKTPTTNVYVKCFTMEDSIKIFGESDYQICEDLQYYNNNWEYMKRENKLNRVLKNE